MASRRKGRIAAFQAMYAKESGADLHDFSWTRATDGSEPDWLSFARLLFDGTVENLTAVDAQISAHLDHWDIQRLRKVDLAIMRVSTYALLYQQGIPARVTIDEAVHIAKEFGSDDSYKFVNGVLDSIRKEIQQDSTKVSKA